MFLKNTKGNTRQLLWEDRNPTTAKCAPTHPLKVWKTTCVFTLENSHSAARCAHTHLLGRAAWRNICKHTKENLSAVNTANLRAGQFLAWRNTKKHMRSPSAANSVSLPAEPLLGWRHTSKPTQKRSILFVRSASCIQQLESSKLTCWELTRGGPALLLLL